MRFTDKQHKVFKWITRILALLTLVFGLMFYFGYGNPLPFIDPSYSAWDNLWLCVFPIMFIGLALGWFFPRVGGWMTASSVAIGLIVGLAIRGEFMSMMLAPLFISILFIMIGSCKPKE